MTMLVKLIGLLGGICFAYCGVPAALFAVRSGRTNTPAIVAWMIFLGAVFMYTYLTILHGFDAILTLNYTVEAASWAIVVWFIHFPRK